MKTVIFATLFAMTASMTSAQDTSKSEGGTTGHFTFVSDDNPVKEGGAVVATTRSGAYTGSGNGVIIQTNNFGELYLKLLLSIKNKE